MCKNTKTIIGLRLGDYRGIFTLTLSRRIFSNNHLALGEKLLNIKLLQWLFGLGAVCSTNMFASRYSRTMMGKMLLEHLETKNEPIDRVQVIDTKYLNIYNSFALYVN
jgi:hypothetical protein